MKYWGGGGVFIVLNALTCLPIWVNTFRPLGNLDEAAEWRGIGCCTGSWVRMAWNQSLSGRRLDCSETHYHWEVGVSWSSLLTLTSAHTCAVLDISPT